jgi:hypothetical protein
MTKINSVWLTHADVSTHRTASKAACNKMGIAGVTSYALRHSSIVRALLGGVPVAVGAQQHDTSVREIEAHYAAYILDYSDALSRRALLDTSRPMVTDNVVPLPRTARE